MSRLIQVLGLSALSHDAAACVVRHGQILFAGLDRAVPRHHDSRELPGRGTCRSARRRRAGRVARGRAEFGPRALGNRSLLADPRPEDSRDRVHRVKGREPFRPFAPVIRQELADRYFDMPVRSSPYMQFTSRCRDPRAFPGIVHVDGTSRVQTVTREQHPGLYDLLGEFERRTGCPMLLNTSLDLKGEPLVNDWEQARRFADRTGVPVL